MNRVLSALKDYYKGIDKDVKSVSPAVVKYKSDELIAEVGDLRPVDFNKKYRDVKKQEGFKEYLTPPEYFRCDKCGKWILIVPIQDCCPEFLDKFKQILDKRKPPK